jgi:hypothetical protein
VARSLTFIWRSTPSAKSHDGDFTTGAQLERRSAGSGRSGSSGGHGERRKTKQKAKQTQHARHSGDELHKVRRGAAQLSPLTAAPPTARAHLYLSQNTAWSFQHSADCMPPARSAASLGFSIGPAAERSRVGPDWTLRRHVW